MGTRTDTWNWTSVASMHEAIDKLFATRGVRSIRILPGQLEYEHTTASRPDLLPRPEELRITWDQVMGETELLRYNCRSLVEGIVWGSVELLKRQRVPTHLLVWDRRKFYKEAFGDSWWSSDREFNEVLWGLRVVDLQVLLGDGKVIICGGPKSDGEPEDIDTGLILERS